MKVGISFVSAADAAATSEAEHPGWSLDHVRTRRHRSLERPARSHRHRGRNTRPSSAPSTPRSTTRSSHPNVVSDVNGALRRGADGTGPPAAAHRIQYANFSEWDIYRSEIQLVALVGPHQAGDMVQSLVDDAEQDGWLPKWAIVGGRRVPDERGLGRPHHRRGLCLRRPQLRRPGRPGGHGQGGDRGRDRSRPRDRAPVPGPVPGRSTTSTPASLDLTSIDYSIGGSVTLEYAIDDFAIAQVALGLTSDRSLYADHDAAGPQLGVPVQSRHRVHRRPEVRRQLPPGAGVPAVHVRARRPDSASRRATPSSTPGRSPRTSPPWPR